MEKGLSFFKQKLFWVGFTVVLLLLSLLGFAFINPAVSSKPKNLPVALVVLDQQGNAGNLLKEKLLANTQIPLKWTVVASEKEALDGMDRQQFYGAMVLKQATIKIILNGGMNAQGVSVAKQVFNQILNQVQIPLENAKAPVTPIKATENTVHSLGAQANGSLPVLMTQLLWLSSMITALFLHLIGKKTFGGVVRFPQLASQIGYGLVFILVASSWMIWMASQWYGMEMSNITETWLFLMYTGASFFLLQLALLNGIGVRAMAIFVLLFFFSMPVINMPPEFLSNGIHDWLYSWVPLRFASEGLRHVMYFGKGITIPQSLQVFGVMDAVCLLLLLVIPFKHYLLLQNKRTSPTI